MTKSDKFKMIKERYDNGAVIEVHCGTQNPYLFGYSRFSRADGWSIAYNTRTQTFTFTDDEKISDDCVFKKSWGDRLYFANKEKV